MNSRHLFSFFKEESQRQAMEKDGFLRIPFFGAEEVQQLRQIFEEVRPNFQLQGFATTTTHPDFLLKKTLFEQILPFYEEKLAEMFEGIKLLGCSFLQKDPGQSGFLPLHQDWTATDERHFRTVTIWIPLVDTDAQSGAMQVIPGSHLWSNILRGPNIPPKIGELDEKLRERLLTLPMQAGEALIFDHSLLHASTLHEGAEPRLALTFGLCQADAPMRFWYLHKEQNELECLAMPDDFFLRYHQIGSRPNFAASLGRYQQDQAMLDSNEVAQMMNGEALHRPIQRILRPDLPALPISPARITRNLDVNVRLANEGYALFPFLNAAELQELKAFFEEKQAEKVERFYASVHNPDIAFRLEMDAKIRSVLAPKLKPFLNEGELLGSSFIAKPKGNPGILPPHSDWNIVDERLFRSYNLWIPLVDTTVENGAVHIIPGSHNWWDDFRGPGIKNPYAQHSRLIWEALQPLEMKAGTALLYDHRLLHASPQNQTDQLRLAIVSGIKPKSAQMFYYAQSEMGIQAFKSNPDFYLRENPENGPGNLDWYEDVCDSLPDISEEQLLRFLGKDNPVEIQSHPSTEGPTSRSFWQTYTLANIWRELKWRLSGKA